ncbi:MAG: urate hydroxylase PuuD [Polyangiaceae bacterium]|nr:urate hydroxylase PuuD [Polyangiaceae bacterium]
MDAHLRELLDLVIRWVHVIAGIMWIGNSLLFNWLDRNLVKLADRDARHEGEIWLLHSGGFYQVEKKQLPPGQMPAMLHWFKWQNFTTWASGISLLVVVYYMGGGALLADPSVTTLHPHAQIGVGVGTIVGAWVVYDGLFRSPLAKIEWLASLLGLGLLFGLAYGLTHVMSGRAAFLHVGVVIGTLMTGNVWMVIVPSQRELVAATTEGREQDKRIGMRAKARSIHNNYFTFPLLFIMVSNHFPSTFGAKLPWAVLALILFVGAGVRHLMNIRFHTKGWFPPLVGLCVAGLAGLFALTRREGPKAPSGPPVSFAEAQAIVQQRCVPCHSQHPTDDVWKAPPSGVVLDAPAQMKLLASRIRERAVVTRSMPLGNKTNMTDDERDRLARWVAAGAPIE